MVNYKIFFYKVCFLFDLKYRVVIIKVYHMHVFTQFSKTTTKLWM